MSQETWTAVDEYIVGKLVPTDEALEAALSASVEAELPAINVTRNQGKLLHLLARVQQARSVLEIGTLGGYSTIWLARALPAGGRLVTLEADPHHAGVARSNIERAGLSGLVELREGPALETLPGVESAGYAPFDLVFIDADKPNNANYLQWALKLSRPGTLIIVDNAVRRGSVVDEQETDPRVRGTRALYDALAAEPRLSATAMQTVGSKGYDGFVLAVVNQ